MIRVNTFNVVNNSKESAGHPPISGNVVNNHAPDPRSGEQLAVVLRSCCSSLSCLSFSVMCGVKKSLVSVNHFSCQCIFLGFLRLEKDAHVCPGITSDLIKISDRQEHLMVHRGREEPGRDGTCGIQPPHLLPGCWASKHLDAVWTQFFLFSLKISEVCLRVYQTDVLISEKKNHVFRSVCRFPADLRIKKISKWKHNTLEIYFSMCFKSVYLSLTSEGLSEFTKL